MAFGFGGKSGADNAKLSPEHQLTKLREQARSGGDSSNGRQTQRVPVEHSIVPTAVDSAPSEKQGDEKGITLELTPDANDPDMEELLGILRVKGFGAVLKELDRLDNAHPQDD